MWKEMQMKILINKNKSQTNKLFNLIQYVRNTSQRNHNNISGEKKLTNQQTNNQENMQLY